MILKKFLSIFLSMVLMLSAVACGSAEDHSNSTLVGEVLSADGTTVTLQLGTLEQPSGGGDSPQDAPPSGDGTQSEAPPEKPGDGSETAQSEGTAPSGDGTQGGTPPTQSGTQSETPPEKPGDGSETTQSEGAAPSGDGTQGGGFGGVFTAGEETAKIDLKGAEVTLADGSDGAVSDIAVGDILTVVVGDSNKVASATVENTGHAGGGTSGAVSYTAANSYTQDAQVSDVTLASTGTDENAVLVTDGAKVALSGVVLTRDSQDSTGGDNSSFYGVGAVALVTDGTLTITDSTITSDAAGGAGVFAYGDGVAYVSDTQISTQKGTAGGIHVAGGGTLYAWDLTVDTAGASSAAIRSDRGSGTMVVDGGSYTSNGSGSPAVYSTADITIHDAALAATGAEAVCIEGFNTVRLFDCDLTGSMPTDNEQNDCVWNVILYQSMSGDSAQGNSTFEMVGGTLKANSGGMFYTTNTESTFIISGVDITGAADSDFLLKCTGNSNARGWGASGANGADCRFTALAQTLQGDVLWDSISQLDFYLVDGSVLTGAFLNDASNAGDGGDGYAALYISSDSSWVVTGDSVLSSLACAGKLVDASGNTVSVVGTDGTVYARGTSGYTVTVGSYSATADVSGASSVDRWESFEVERA
ncbi:MAG: proline-rich domain-containing protein [Oscillospiraceae bacterium]|nr:proline-rich domain-containing protein [Oscillospiraceae bacterium]